MSFPFEHYREPFMCDEVKVKEMLFDERSKTEEHTDRFQAYDNSQKSKKTEDI